MPKHAYALDRTKLEWVDYAVQGTYQGNEFKRNSSGNAWLQSSMSVASLTGHGSLIGKNGPNAIISHQRCLSIAGKLSENSFGGNNTMKRDYNGLKT